MSNCGSASQKCQKAEINSQIYCCCLAITAQDDLSVKERKIVQTKCMMLYHSIAFHNHCSLAHQLKDIEVIN